MLPAPLPDPMTNSLNTQPTPSVNVRRLVDARGSLAEEDLASGEAHDAADRNAVKIVLPKCDCLRYDGPRG